MLQGVPLHQWGGWDRISWENRIIGLKPGEVAGPYTSSRRAQVKEGWFVQVQIATRHGQLSDEHQTLIHEKAEKLLHFFDRITMIEVTVDLQHDEKAVEVHIDAEHKHDFVATSRHPDLLAAVDQALSKAQQQLRKYKEKIQDHRRDPSSNGGPPHGT